MNISRWVSVHCIVLPPQWGTHQTVHLPSILPDHEYLKVGFCSLYRASPTVGNPSDGPPTQYTAGPWISQGGFLFTVSCFPHSGEPIRRSTYPVYCPTTNISRWVSVHCIVLPPTVGNPSDRPPTQYTAPIVGNPSDVPPTQYTAGPWISQGGFLFTVSCFPHSGEPIRRSTYPVYCPTTNISRWVSVHCIVLPPTVGNPSDRPPTQYTAPIVGNPSDVPPTQYTAGPWISQGWFPFTVAVCHYYLFGQFQTVYRNMAGL